MQGRISREQFRDNIRFSFRQLWRNPGFTLIAMLTLALGIGANTGIFSVLQSAVLAPLPYDHPDRLVMIWPKNSRGLHISLSGPDFRDWKRSARSFDSLAGFRWQAHDLSKPGSPEHLDGKEISAGFFSTLGVKLALGREFTESEDQHGGPPVLIISNRFWQSRFGGSQDALGKLITLDGIDYAVVGILPARFHFEGNTDVYLPLNQGDPLILNDRTLHSGILCIGRLKANLTVEQAKADVEAIQNNLDQLYPNADQGLSIDIVSLKQEVVGDSGQMLFMLLGAVALVLLIACANIANLLLARSAARNGEFAVRLALGASRAHIITQLITESVILSLAGSVLGLAIAIWGVRPILAALPGAIEESRGIGIDLPVLLFTFGLALVIGILFGLMPALNSSRTDLQSVLREGGRGSVRGRNRAQSILVVAQMVLTLLLLTGASLLFRTVHELLNVNPGFYTQHLITFKVGLSPSVTATAQGMRTAYQQLTDRIERIPGVNSADLTTLVPLTQQDNSVPFWLGSEQPASIAEAPRALMYETGPNYLRTMGIPLLQGRFFTMQDDTNAPQVVVIDSLLARAYFPGKDPVGQTINFAHIGPYRVIGVVGHVKHWGLGKMNKYTQYQVYTPFYQIPDKWMPVMHSLATVVVQTSLEPVTVLPAIKSAVYGTASDQPVYEVHTIEGLVSESMNSQRYTMILLGAFALLALLLASVGIYGVISYLMTLRIHEIGIRMAVGAGRGDVLRMVLGEGLRLATVGIAIGIVCALILGHVVSSFSQLLYGVGSSDPLTLVGVSICLVVTTLLACYIPARRAAKTDPMTALRYQ